MARSRHVDLQHISLVDSYRPLSDVRFLHNFITIIRNNVILFYQSVVCYVVCFDEMLIIKIDSLVTCGN